MLENKENQKRYDGYDDTADAADCIVFLNKPGILKFRIPPVLLPYHIYPP